MLSVYQFAFILLSWSPVTWWHGSGVTNCVTDGGPVITAWHNEIPGVPPPTSHLHLHQGSLSTGAASSDARYPAKKTNKTDAMFWSVDVVVSVRRMSGEVTENHYDHLIYGLLRYFCVLILIFWIFLLADKLWADYPGLAPVTDYNAAVMC